MVAPPPSNVRETRQLSKHGQKFDPEWIWAYLIWNFEPIFGQQISILEPVSYTHLTLPTIYSV